MYKYIYEINTDLKMPEIKNKLKKIIFLKEDRIALSKNLKDKLTEYKKKNNLSTYNATIKELLILSEQTKKE